MPILELQKRARELGRIRIGQKGAKGQPVKLDRFRLTSHSQPLIAKVAELYGGHVSEWTPQGGAQQWECVTDANRIPIMVPPQPVSQWLETWTGGGCVHRCDGVTEVISGEPCDLGPDHEAAKPTTRLNVVLRDVEGIGVWRLESHGWNAAVELPDVAAFLAQAGGYVNGWLSLEERVSKSNGQTRRFIVPTIEIDVTPAELMAGRGNVAAPAIEAATMPAITTAQTPDYVALARDAISLDDVRSIYRMASTNGHLTEELGNQLIEIGQRFTPAPPVTDADPDQVWQQILAEAGRQQMDLQAVLDGFPTVTGGVTAETASAADMQKYLDHLRASVTA
jgi:hypothetical protein